MAVVVWGAGAIGGSVGAYLVARGHDVLLVDRDAAHVDAIRQGGLLVDGAREPLRVEAAALSPEEVRGSLDLVLFSVKAQHTRAAIRQVAPLLAPDGVVVSLQNGLNHEPIAEVIGLERTIPTFVNFAADLVAPGHIRYGGDAPTYLGEIGGAVTPRVERLRDLLADFGPTVATDNIVGYLWAKLAMISILFGTALVDADVADILDREPGRTLLALAARETLNVAAAAGVRPMPFGEFDPARFRPDATVVDLGAGVDAVGNRFRGMLKTRSGYWRDLAVRKRPTEVGEQVGVVVRRGADLGVPTPLNAGILALILEIESGSRQQDWANLAALAARARTA